MRGRGNKSTVTSAISQDLSFLFVPLFVGKRRHSHIFQMRPHLAHLDTSYHNLT
jgi:hypothetical protein